MKITKLEAENFKRLRAVEITPDGAIVTVRGSNGQGKTSCLDAIASALGGEKLAPAEPVRRGAKGAVVRLELDDGLVVERRWSAGGGSSLKLTNKEGLRYEKPQKRLDDLIGKLSFDPLAFLRLKPAEQAETLRKLAGVDFSIMDSKRRDAFESRTAVNRQVAQLEARLATMPEVTDTPAEPVSAAELLVEQQRRQKVKSDNELARAELRRQHDAFRARQAQLEERQADVVRLEAELVRARERVAAAEAEVEQARERGREMKARVEALKDPDLEVIPKQLREVETTNERVRARQARAEFVMELKVAGDEAERLTGVIEVIDDQKAKDLAQAKFPVDGLSFNDTGVRFQDVPFEQASGAEQLRVSVAMAIAMNPKLQVMLIRDGSLLDERSLALLAEMAEASGHQVWLEVVGKLGAGVVIEDGQVEGAEPVATEKGAA